VKNTRGAGYPTESYRQRVTDALDSLDPDCVVAASHRLVEARSKGGCVFVVGNGGSASTASHMATDLGVGSHKIGLGIRAICLNDSSSVLTATANDLGFERVFAEQLSLLASHGDVLIAISASGNSPDIIAAAQLAKTTGLTVIGLTGFDGGVLKNLSDISVHVQTRVGDYGPTEDVHLVVNHMLTEMIRGLNP